MADTNEQKIEYTKKLMEKALKDEHSQYELLVNLTGLVTAANLKHADKVIAKAFYKSANKLLSQYLDKLYKKIDDVQLLINYRQFKQCGDFYLKEADVLKRSITEFHNYMFTYGNLINTLCGYTRPEDQMYEYLDVGEMHRYND